MNLGKIGASNSMTIQNNLIQSYKDHGIAVAKNEYDTKTQILKIVLLFQVRPGVKRETIQVLPSGEIKIGLNIKPIEGKANKELCKRIGKALGISASNAVIETGEHSKIKRMALFYDLSQAGKGITYYQDKLQNFLSIFKS